MASVLAIDIVIVCHSHPEKNAATHLNYDYPVAGIFRVIGVSTSFRVSLIFMGYFTFPMALWVAIRWWNKAGWVKDWWSVWLGTSGPSHMANCWFQLRLQLHLRNHPPSYRHHLQPHLSVSATHVVPSNTWSPPTTAAQKKCTSTLQEYCTPSCNQEPFRRDLTFALKRVCHCFLDFLEGQYLYV